jgi:hypothetical protein
MQTILKIKTLVKNECANYNYENGTCYPTSCLCSFFTDSETPIRCRYFESSVLPIDAELDYEYRSERQMTSNYVAKPEIRCKRCNEFVSASSNRQKYCDKCKKLVQKEQSRLRMMKMRG